MAVSECASTQNFHTVKLNRMKEDEKNSHTFGVWHTLTIGRILFSHSHSLRVFIFTVGLNSKLVQTFGSKFPAAKLHLFVFSKHAAATAIANRIDENQLYKQQ